MHVLSHGREECHPELWRDWVAIHLTYMYMYICILVMYIHVHVNAYQIQGVKGQRNLTNDIMVNSLIPLLKTDTTSLHMKGWETANTPRYLPQRRALLWEGCELNGDPLLAVVLPALLYKEGIGSHPASNAGLLTGRCGDDHVGTLLLDEGFYGIQGGAWRERGDQHRVREGVRL